MDDDEDDDNDDGVVISGTKPEAVLTSSHGILHFLRQIRLILRHGEDAHAQIINKFATKCFWTLT